MGFIFPSLPLRFLPFLNCSHILASQLLVEFMDSLDDVQIQIGRWLGLGFRFGSALASGFGSALASGFGSALASGFGSALISVLGSALVLGFGSTLAFRLRFSFGFRLRFGLSFVFLESPAPPSPSLELQ